MQVALAALAGQPVLNRQPFDHAVVRDRRAPLLESRTRHDQIEVGLEAPFRTELGPAAGRRNRPELG